MVLGTNWFHLEREPGVGRDGKKRNGFLPERHRSGARLERTGFEIWQQGCFGWVERERVALLSVRTIRTAFEKFSKSETDLAKLSETAGQPYCWLFLSVFFITEADTDNPYGIVA